MASNRKAEILFLVIILLILAFSIVLCIHDSKGEIDEGGYEDDYYSEEEPEVEPTETPAFGVPEGQVKMDIDEMMKSDTYLAGVCRRLDGYETLEVVSHDYDEASQIDNARIEYWFRTWFGRIKYSKDCVYQYSKDSGLWNFLSGEESEYEDIQYDEETLNALVGRSIVVSHSYHDKNAGSVTINSVEISGKDCYMNISYGLDRGKEKGWTSGEERIALSPQLARCSYGINGWGGHAGNDAHFELADKVTGIDEYGDEFSLYVFLGKDEETTRASYYD